MFLLDPGAEIREDRDCMKEELFYFGVDLGVTQIGRESDAQVLHAVLERGAVIARVVGQGVPVARVGKREDVEHQRGVGDTARDRPDVRDGAKGDSGQAGTRPNEA